MTKTISKVNLCIDSDKLISALQDEAVVRFVKKLRIVNYKNCTHIQQAEITAMFNEGINLLQKCLQENGDLQETIDCIINKIFLKEKEELWANKFENYYRSQIRPEIEFQDIQPYLIGKKILDIGCGAGNLSSKLMDQGYECVLTDVIDYRTKKAKASKFILNTDPSYIPFPDHDADTVLLFLVLHHIKPEDFDRFMKQLIRKGKRIIIKEDVYDVESYSENYKPLQPDPFFEEFKSFQKEQQYKILTLSDFVSNVFLQKISNMEFPFGFKTVQEWEESFKKYGLKLIVNRIEGMRRDNSEFFGSCHGYFVLDVTD